MGPYLTPWQYSVSDPSELPYTVSEVEQLMLHYLWYPAAESYKALGLAEKALSLYQEALTHYETVVDKERNGIITSFKEESGPDAVKFWSMPRNLLWYLIGKLHRELRDFNNAITAFEKAFQAEPMNNWLKTVIENTRSMLEERREDDSIIDRDSNEDRRTATLVEE